MRGVLAKLIWSVSLVAMAACPLAASEPWAPEAVPGEIVVDVVDSADRAMLEEIG
ncbi:MAG: hypothetical protein HY815_05750, partial [Candidatus Riflebacteria bacterium]|nr:hypothetical protein [Candidatus Riflebacteria bacterium]